MLEPFNEEIAREAQTSLGESIQDLSTMIRIIADARLARFREYQQEQVRVAMVAGCAGPHPGKPPSYHQAIRRFRLTFLNIAADIQMQKEFESRLKRRLLDTPHQTLLSAEYRWNIEDMFDVRYAAMER